MIFFYSKENIIFLNDEIGGRFSIWSEVSLLSIIESEKTFASFLAGGHAADLEIKSKKRYKKTIKKLSYIDLWNSNFLNTSLRLFPSTLPPNSEISAPAIKALPFPVKTMPFTSESSSAFTIEWFNSSKIDEGCEISFFFSSG